MMHIQDFKLVGSDTRKVAFLESKNVGGKFKARTPDMVVIHYTGSPDAKSAIDHLVHPRNKVSAHLVIDFDGSVTQLVPFDTIAWHAGRSKHLDRSGLNKFSIGIEIVNAGYLTRQGDIYLSWFGKSYHVDEVYAGVHRNQTEISYWQRYTAEQIAVASEICELLIDTYGIKYIVGHEEVSPQRKVDPGPAFPLDIIRQRALSPDRHHDEAEENPLPDQTPELPIQKGLVMADKLNIRLMPGIQSVKVAEPLSKGTIVGVVGERDGWYKVRVETWGWVSKEYVKI